VATREGVEKVSDSSHLLPATKNQQQLISEILKMLPYTADLFEYEDYLNNPTRENASEFISIAFENNLDLIGKKKNFVDTSPIVRELKSSAATDSLQMKVYLLYYQKLLMKYQTIPEMCGQILYPSGAKMQRGWDMTAQNRGRI
jgi:hypothetical protein